MNNNTLTVIGTVATHPRLITGQSGVSFCSFRLASTDRHFDRKQGEWVTGETNWFTVNCFRSLAEHVHASFKKGERAIVHGRLRIRDWHNNDKNGTSIEIEADALGHDLRFGTSRYEKQTQAQNDEFPAANSASDAEDELNAPQTQTSSDELSGDNFIPAAA